MIPKRGQFFRTRNCSVGFCIDVGEIFSRIAIVRSHDESIVGCIFNVLSSSGNRWENKLDAMDIVDHMRATFKETIRSPRTRSKS